MPYVRIFNNLQPPARGDRVFTQARIEERPNDSTSWTPLETITLLPVDTNPLHPLLRSLTTSLAVYDPGYYRIIWHDAIGGEIASPTFYSDADPTLGPIAQKIKAMIPRTWQGLNELPEYGASFLEESIENAKYMELPATMAAQSDATYTPLMQIFIAKVAALELLPAAIEFWARQKITISMTGTNETTSYSDPIVGLKELAKTLREQVARMRGLPGLVGATNTPSELPSVTGMDDPLFQLVSADPYEFDPAFFQTPVAAGA